MKFELENYSSNVNKVVDFLEKLFPRCSVYINHSKPKSIGEFNVFMYGLGLDSGSDENSYVLFGNTKINQFPSEVRLYDNFCYLVMRMGGDELIQ